MGIERSFRIALIPAGSAYGKEKGLAASFPFGIESSAESFDSASIQCLS